MYTRGRKRTGKKSLMMDNTVTCPYRIYVAACTACLDSYLSGPGSAANFSYNSGMAFSIICPYIANLRCG